MTKGRLGAGGALVTALALGPGPADAQDHQASTREAFLDEAAAAAQRYADRREAMADGFRRLGPDFPGMGVHWVQPGRIVSGALTGDAPPVLCYVDIDGRPTLVGLAYTLPLSARETPPEEPFGPEVWHDHSGEVTEESLLLNHPSTLTARDTEFRLAMVHVWLPLANPSGILAQNNWKLPFLRVGLEPPSRPSPLAARGLSLGAAGLEYYRELLYWASPVGSPDRALIDAALAERSREVDRWIARRQAHDDRGGVTREDLVELEGLWHALWDDLERALSADTYERIRPLRRGHE